jgi:hypothetical protein
MHNVEDVTVGFDKSTIGVPYDTITSKTFES